MTRPGGTVDAVQVAASSKRQHQEESCAVPGRSGARKRVFEFPILSPPPAQGAPHSCRCSGTTPRWYPLPVCESAHVPKECL